MSYATVANINQYLGISGEDALIGQLNTSAEIILNNLIGTTGLAEASAISENIEFPTIHDDNGLWGGHIFYLARHNPTVITSVDWVAINSWDYEIKGQRVFLKNSLSYKTTFPFKNTIVYTAGYATIPDDIKQAVYMIVGALYNTRKAGGIDSFRQDLLSVTYSKTSSLNDIMEPNSFSLLSSIIHKYTIPLIICSGANRMHY